MADISKITLPDGATYNVKDSSARTTLNSKLNTSLKGAANGLAELDSSGKVPASQLPSYVDDVIEGYLYNNKFYKESAHTTEITGETGKIYVDLSNNKTYRWSGSAFVVISETLALGETSSTAYRGDRGKVAYDHASAKGSAFSSGLYKITTNSAGHVTAATAVTKTDITSLGIPSENTTYGVATSSALGLIKSGTDITVDSNGNVSVNDDSHNHVISNIDGLQTALDGKAASSHNQASSTINAMTGYSKPSSTSAIAASDTLNAAIGKLEKALDGKQASGSYVPTTRKVNGKALSADITLNAGDVGAIHSALTSNGTTATTTKGYTYGVAAVTTSPYTYAKWFVYLDTGVTTLTNGMLIRMRIPVAGDSHGTCITIDGTNFHPIVLNTNSIVTTHFGSGSELLLMYDSNSSASVYSNSATAAAISGVWRVMNTYADGDSKTSQTNTTTSADYRLLLSNTADDNTRTEAARKSTNFKANPATGAFYAKGYTRIDLTGQTLDINTLNLSTGSPHIMHYIEKTSGGSNNITNIPVTGQPFLLDVELIRWVSASDYISRQTFRNANNPANEYVRFCTNGTWSGWTTRVFTDTNTKNTAGSTDTSSKIFLIGATSQAANPQTYSHDTAYVGTDGCLYSDSKKVVTTDDSRLSNARTPVTHNQASSTINAMTGYSKPSSTSAIATSDTLNAAIGKLEKALDGKQASGSYAAASHTHDDRYYTESEMNTKLSAKLDASLKGAANGVASLGSNGKVPSSQLPSTIDVLSADPTSPAIGYIWITTS